MTQDDYEVRARLAVARGERATERRRLLQHGEVIATDERAEDLARSVASERRLPPRVAIGHQSGERLGAVTIGEVLGRGERLLPGKIRDALDRLRDRHELVRPGRGQAAKEHGIDDGEDARIDANAEGKRHHRNYGERRVLAKGAQAVAHVLPPCGPGAEPDLAHILAGEKDVTDGSTTGVRRLLRRQTLAR